MAPLRAHMEDLVQRAEKQGVAHSKFLTAAQCEEVRAAYATRKDVLLHLDGGFADAERRVAAFTAPAWGVFEREDVLAGLRLQYRQQDAVAHRDVLGAALGLGLSREVLGDIFVREGQAHLVCLASMADFIAAELDQVGRVGVHIERVPLTELPELPGVLQEKPVTVASPRLDAIVATAFGLSRSAACEAIRGGKVQLAHKECQNPAQTVGEGDIISLRGKGRVKLLAEKDFSRKGRQRLVLGFYTS